jgi:hypothetical protein
MPDTQSHNSRPETYSPGESLQLLHALRDMLGDRAASAYAERLKDARDDLVQLAKRANDRSRRELYEAGHALLANGGQDLLQCFRDTFGRVCDNAIGILNGQDTDAWENVNELSLVDATAFERDLAVARLSSRAAYACSQQLTSLERRIAALLGLKRLDPDGNPFSVKRLFDTFVDAAEANWAGSQLSLILLETFEHYTADRLPEIYRGLNEHLVEHGVLPKLPVGLEERERELDRPHQGGGDTVGDVFVQLASGLMGERGAHSQGLGPAAPDGGDGGGPSGGLPPGLDGTGGHTPAMVLGLLIDGLSGLQRGNSSAAAKLGVDLASMDAESTAGLRSLAASPLLRWLQPQDAATIELVAMLFDCIFKDREVPAQLRGEIGKLQLPVLKVALMNKAFFSDHHHPARRLLDVIAAGARGWSTQDEQTLLARIKAAVDNVLTSFEQDTSVFKVEVEHIEAMLRDAERAARSQVGELVQRLEQRDRQLVAEAVVADQIKRRLAMQPLPPSVVRFIDEHWGELLRRIYVKRGDGSEDWRDALDTLADLIWSLQSKAAPEDRQRLVHLLPKLLEQLPAGLTRIGRKAAWEPFLCELMPLHMAAIKQTEPATPPAPSSSSEAADMAVAVRGASTAGEARTDSATVGEAIPWPSQTGSERLDPSAPDTEVEGSQEAVEPAPASAASDTRASAEPSSGGSQDPHLEAARAVEVGDWLEVEQLGDASLSLCASWMSRQSGLILFADRRGRNARVLSVDRLAVALRQGHARLLSRDPLTNRAVAQLLVKASPAEPTAA